MGVLVLYTSLVGLSKRATTLPAYSGVQSGIILTALCMILLLRYGQPYTPPHAWKRLVGACLHGLTALTALVNAVSFRPAGQPSTLSEQARMALAIVPLCYAVVLACVLLASWWFNGVRFGLQGGKRSTADAGAAAGDTGEAGLAVVDNPMLTGTPPGLWERIHDPQDGDTYWHNALTGESVWELPSGAATACGWRHDAAAGIWRNAATGAVSTSAPYSRKEPAPAPAPEPEPEPAAAVPEPLPPPPPEDLNVWKRVTDDDGDTFYVNVTTGATSWTLPPHAILEPSTAPPTPIPTPPPPPRQCHPLITGHATLRPISATCGSTTPPWRSRPPFPPLPPPPAAGSRAPSTAAGCTARAVQRASPPPQPAPQWARRSLRLRVSAQRNTGLAGWLQGSSGCGRLLRRPLARPPGAMSPLALLQHLCHWMRTRHAAGFVRMACGCTVAVALLPAASPPWMRVLPMSSLTCTCGSLPLQQHSEARAHTGTTREKV